MTRQATPQITDLNERKAIGRAHLNAKRVEEALQVYARILRDYPEDVDAYLFLGDCYLADGDSDTALYLYSQALEYSPTTPEIQRRISMARAQCVQRWSTPTELQHVNIFQGKQILSHPQSLVSLLQTLTSQPAMVTDAEVVKATLLLDEIVQRSHPAEAVAERLEEIDELLPALIELNIRRAQAEGRPDLAEALQDLLQDLQAEKTSRSNAEGDPPAGLSVPTTLRILFLEPAASEQNLPAQALKELGCLVTTAAELPAGGTGQFDAVIAYRPHGDPRLMESLAACAAAKLPILLNLDQDFDQMPLDHPDYERYGLGTPGRAKAYAAALLLANVLRVPSDSLAAVFRSSSHQVEVIPDGWSRQNELWKKPANTRHTLNLGWIGSPGELEDVFQIRRVIIRLIREFPQVRLVIGGDTQVYKLFDTLPEGRCLFLPSVSPDDYPYLLAQVDILFVPLRNTPYNRAASDRRLMEAGVRGIPWVASPVPAFTAWNVGGLIAHTADEWHTNLRQLILDAGLRTSLGQSGRKRAEIREMAHLGPTWFSLVEKTMEQQEH